MRLHYYVTSFYRLASTSQSIHTGSQEGNSDMRARSLQTEASRRVNLGTFSSFGQGAGRRLPAPWFGWRLSKWREHGRTFLLNVWYTGLLSPRGLSRCWDSVFLSLAQYRSISYIQYHGHWELLWIRPLLYTPSILQISVRYFVRSERDTRVRTF